MIGIHFFLNLKMDPTSTKEKLKRIDLLGILVFITSLTILLFTLTAGGTLYPWKSASVIGSLVVGIFGMIGFLFIEEYVVREPMIPLRVFKERTAFAGYLGTLVHGIILWGLIYYAILWV